MSRGGRYFLLIADDGAPPDSVTTISKSLSDTVIAADLDDFPQTSILDNFNRLNGSLGAEWSSDPLNEEVSEPSLSSQVCRSSTGVHAAYYSAQSFGPDCEVYITIVSHDFWSLQPESLSLLVRLQDPATAGVDGYEIKFTANSLDVQATRISTGASLGDGGDIPSLAEDDKVGVRIVGDCIQAYHQPAGGNWSLVASWTDNNVSGSGYLGIEIYPIGGYRYCDNFGGGDILPLTSTVEKALADTAVATEALTVALALALADNGVATEAMTFAVALTLADSGVASEVMSRVMAFAREFSDTAVATEAITERMLARSLADSLVASQTSVALHPNLALEETPVATDVLSRVVTFLRTFTDTPVATESPAKALTLDDWTDSVAAGDSLAWIYMMAPVEEALTAAESLTTEAGLSLSDTAVATEVLAIAAALAAFADSVAAGDSLVLHPHKALADGAGGADEITSCGPGRRLTDTALAGDSISSFVVSAALADTAVATEALAKAVALAAFADSVTAGEDLSAALGLAKALADSLGASEALTLAIELALADGSALSDALTKAMGLALADGAAGGEAMTPIAGQVLTDTALAGDAIASFVIGAALADNPVATDALTKALSTSLADTAVATEALAKAVALAAFTDGVAVVDATTLEPNIGLSLAMAVVVGESMTRAPNKALADTVVATFATPTSMELPGVRLKLWGDAEGRGVGEVLRLCEGDTLPILSFRLADADDGIYDLDEAMVTFRMWQREGSVYTVDAAATVLADSGWVEYRLQAADTATAGEYRAHLVIASGGREFVSETFIVRIRERL